MREHFDCGAVFFLHASPSVFSPLSHLKLEGMSSCFSNFLDKQHAVKENIPNILGNKNPTEENWILP